MTTGDVALPTVIASYRLVARIGSGGMGSVWIAEKQGQHGFSKRVALKLMLPHLVADASARALFLDEARLAARLNHSNVAHVFDFGEDRGFFYLAMELVEGTSVDALLEAHTKVAGPIAARIVADAARGLHHAHTLVDESGAPLGVVHRDVSPQNLVVTTDGVTKVLDFGIAKSKERQSATQTGLVRGKPAYMSPEQAKSEEVDGRSDVFSLGVVLFQLVTGRALFLRENPYATVRAVVEAPVPDPREDTPELVAPVVDAIRRALARDLERRFASAEELANVLDACAAPREEVARLCAEVPRAPSAEHAEHARDRRTAIAGIPPSSPTESVPDGNATVVVRGPTPPRAREARANEASAIEASAIEEAPRARAPFVRAIVAAIVTAVGALAVAALAVGGRAEGRTADAGVRAVPDAVVLDDRRVEHDAPIVDAGVVTPLVDAGRVGSGAIVDAGSARTKPITKKPIDKPKPVDTPAAPADGYLAVVATQWSRVRVDGRIIGDTPLRAHALPAGAHVVELLDPKDERVLETRDVTIVAGETLTVRRR